MRVLAAAVCVATLFPWSASAQAPLAAPLTLEQVLVLAEQRSESIAAARAGIRRAEGDDVRARSGLFPQLNLALSYDRALASEFDDIVFGPPGGDPNVQGDLEDLPFGRLNTWRVLLSFSQNLYSGGRNGAQRQLALAGRESALVGLVTTRAQLLFDVTQAYYDAALSERMVAIAEATLGQATATLQQTEAAFQAGTQPEFEVLRARVSRDTQNPNVIRQRVNRELALLRLKQLLDLPAEQEIALAESLSADAPAPAAFAARVLPIEAAIQVGDPIKTALDQPEPQVERAPVRQAATTVSLREAALAAAKAERMPSVILTSNYGRVSYPDNIAAPTFNRLNWTIGVTMQMPLLTGGRQRGDELVATADLEQARVQQRQVEELAALDSRSALAELVAARATWEATAGTVEQANRAYEIADVRFQAGVSTQLELSDSRLLLQQAEANRAQAGRDLQVARARVALLPDLPIGTGATGQGVTLPQFVPSAPTAPVQPVPQPGNGQLRNALVAPGAPPLVGGTQ